VVRGAGALYRRHPGGVWPLVDLGLIQRPDLLALDTGCVWGGALTAACLDDAGSVSVVQVPCPQAMKPGL